MRLRTLYINGIHYVRQLSLMSHRRFFQNLNDQAQFVVIIIMPVVIVSLIVIAFTHSQNSAGSEGRMMRRAIEALSKCLEHVEKRVGYVCHHQNNKPQFHRCCLLFVFLLSLSLLTGTITQD